MSKFFTPTLRLSFGLISLVISLVMIAFVIDVVPDERRAEIESRAKMAEALAVQLAGAASRDDIATLKETMLAVVERNPEVASIALRRTDGSLALKSGDHERHWSDPPGNALRRRTCRCPCSTARRLGGGWRLSSSRCARSTRCLAFLMRC